MGKYRFRLSDMMPNAWFYKLKDMGKGKSMKSNFRSSKIVKQCSSPTRSQTKIKSTEAITTDYSNKIPSKNSSFVAEPLIRFTDPLYTSPRNYIRGSETRLSTTPSRNSSHVHNHTRNKRTRIYKQNNNNDSNCSSADQPVYYSLSSSDFGSPEANSKPKDDFGVELLMFDELGSWSSSSCSCTCSCRISSSTADIIIDLNHYPSDQFQKLNEFDAASELELRPILTKPLVAEPSFDRVESQIVGKNNKYVRKLKSRRASLSESFAIVKSSIDPQRDFKESMMEMIMENKLNGFKDLESLLACYLSLNCKEYHPLIVNAFEQIWLDIFCST